MAKRKLKRRKPKPIRVRRIHGDDLKTMVREAARAGLVEAIEHTSNFWNVSDGFKRYIEQQIELQSQALLTTVRSAVRAELTLREIANRREKRRR